MDDTRTTDALEELARLYLTDDRDAEPSSMSPSTDPYKPADADADADADAISGRIGRRPTPLRRVEALMLGHLPGFANPWVSQYAQRRVAEGDGPVLLLRFDAEHVDLDLFTGDSEAGRAAFAQVGDELDVTLRRLAQTVPTMLLHVNRNAPADAERLLRQSPAWTLLTGTDQAALVAGYRLLKQHFDGLGAGDLPSIRLLLLGSDEQRADEAQGKLRRTIERFLQVDATYLGSQQRMVPTQQQQLARFTYQQAAGWSQTIGEFLTDVKDGAFDAASDSALNELEREMLDDEAYRFPGVEEHVDESVGWQPESAEVDETEALADVETAAFASELKADAVTESDAAVDHRSAVEAEAASESESEPEPAMEPKPGNALPHDSSVSGRPALTSLVAGLEALAARCPYVPGIELAVDGEGRMHLLHETLDKPEAGRDAMANLSLVRRWAADHRGLIEQAAGRTVKAERAVAHLFTDEPKPFGRLAYLGEHDDATPLHLHLLKPVTVGEQTAWDHCEIS